MSGTASFRPDIEGLRALAILPILVYHLRPSLLPGGYVGVDIFYVISGFLITRMIVTQGSAFRLRDFYLRRFFRLFPALFATLLGTLVAGWVILGPEDYEALGRSAISAAIGTSNVYFLFAVDYFNAASILHPLLHTWSLGVEEQFYLVWPALLIVTSGWRVPLWLAAAVSGAISFGIIFLWQPAHPQAVFYQMPFRIFEFAIGAGTVSLEEWWNWRSAGWLSAITGSLAALALATAFVVFDAQTPWPGPATLVPALATAGLLLSGSDGIWRLALGAWALRYVGRISYSLYLVHWPIITLYRSYAIVEPDILTLVALAAACLAAATALFLCSETPFRLMPGAPAPGPSATPPHRRGRQLPRGVIITAMALTGACVLAGAATVIGTGGFPSRLDAHRVQAIDHGLTFAGDLCSSKPGRCLFGDRTSARAVYLIGDSHALNLLHGLDRLFARAGIKGIALYAHGCLFAYGSKRFVNGVADEDCRSNVDAAYDLLASSPDPVIIAGSFAGYRGSMGPAEASAPLRQSEGEYYAWLEERMLASLARLRAGARQVVILKQMYSTGIDLPKCLSRPGAAASGACKPWTATEARTAFAGADSMLDRLAARFPSLVVIDPKPELCPGEVCVTGNASDLYFRDAEHLTNVGSDFLIGRLEQQLSAALALH